MSGIAGAFFFDGRPVDRNSLEAMIHSLAHRGMDGSRIWTGVAVGFAHCILRDTPESFYENPPLVNETGGLVVTADARIDNREELIGLLEIEGDEASIPDSFLILKAYEKWGETCVAKLLGDFAFAIWDRYQQRLYCARDPFGVKPFYYSLETRSFIFASEIKALFSWDVVPRRLNELCIVDFILNTHEDKQITFYQGINRLPPANYLIVEPGGTRLVSYWSPDDLPELHLNSEAAYTEGFRQLFTQAVKSRLRSAHPIGCALSGGLDSSSISCVARNLSCETSRKSIATFSALFSGFSKQDRRKIDERSFIEIILATGGFSPHFVEMDSISPLADFEKILWHFDEPYYAPYLSMYQAIYSTAHLEGVRVCLEGIDGDAVVSHGFERITELTSQFKWFTLLNEAKKVSRRSGSSVRRILWQNSVIPLLPQQVLSFGKTVRAGRNKSRLIEAFFGREFSNRSEVKERIRELRKDSITFKTSARQEHQRNINSGLWPYTFESLDKLAAGFSIDLRYPFFDRRLVEFCLTIPPDKKLSDGWTRAILRYSMGGILPEKVRWRTSKADFRPYYQTALKKFEAEVLEDVILRKPGSVEPYIDRANLQAAYQRYLAGSTFSDADVQMIYQAIILSFWLSHHV